MTPRTPQPTPATSGTVSITLPRDLPAAEVLPFARRVEELGFSRLWVIEDLAFRGGFAQAGAVLAATSGLRVGLGIAPAAARNAAFTAMEAATLGALFPGRFTLGLGHGMPTWMRQAGCWPAASPLGLLGEHLQTVRALLHGETVTHHGRFVQLDGVRLVEPPAQPPAVFAGVRGPRSLAIAGERADGTLLAEPVTPEYATRAREQIAASGPHALVGYQLAAVDQDAERARALVRPALEWVGEPDGAAHVAPLPYAGELAELRARSADRAAFTAAVPDAWVEDLSLAGTPARVRERLAELLAGGLDEVVLIPVAADRLAALDGLAAATL